MRKNGAIMIIREVKSNDLDKLQELYLYLHESEKLPNTGQLLKLWREIIEDKNYHIFVADHDGILVSSVTLVIVKNLTRQMRFYALIENVVTHKDYRGKGFASALMNKAYEIAKSEGCYKIMLLTGSKETKTIKFYENCGFNCKDKTGFIKWI
jgi:GNAT superfamily N-acetyltransferase